MWAVKKQVNPTVCVLTPVRLKGIHLTVAYFPLELTHLKLPLRQQRVRMRMGGAADIDILPLSNLYKSSYHRIMEP